jgi:O-antigen ligase
MSASGLALEGKMRHFCLAGLLALPPALTVFLAFNSGGMFETTTAFAALLVLAVAGLAVAVARRPLAGLSGLGASALALLALLAALTLLSAGWSGAEGRALIGFDRVLLYLAVFGLFACLPRSQERFRWLLRGLLAAAAAVALAGLISRLLPDLWPTTTGLVADRLSFPITYWNTFGLLVGTGCVLAVHHTCDAREPAAVRVAAAALLPLLAVALLLTFSRGAIAATVAGVVAYLLVARPAGALGGIGAAAPAVALALAQAYGAEQIHEGLPLTPDAIAEGEHLALVLALCAAGGAALRVLGLAVDAWVAQLPLASPGWRRRTRIAAVAAGALALAAFVAADGPGTLQRQFDRFVDNTHESAPTGGQRERLLEIGNDGRRPLWEVAGDSFREQPLRGSGAGTFQLEWERDRTDGPPRLYAYSLYFETLAELGLVGIVLLVGALLTILVGIALNARGPGRPMYAAALAVVLCWILHAGVDIDWQTPALGVPVFALAGFALARPRERLKFDASRRGPAARLVRLTAGGARPALALICLALAVVPALMTVAHARLRDSVEALDAGACGRARDEAQASIDAIDAGPRPYEVLAMCAARAGEAVASVELARAGVAHDPGSWEPHYALALAQGAAGRDPRRQIAVAATLNPQSPLLEEAAAAVHGGGPERWRRVALSLPFELE